MAGVGAEQRVLAMRRAIAEGLVLVARVTEQVAVLERQAEEAVLLDLTLPVRPRRQRREEEDAGVLARRRNTRVRPPALHIAHRGGASAEQIRSPATSSMEKRREPATTARDDESKHGSGGGRGVGVRMASPKQQQQQQQQQQPRSATTPRRAMAHRNPEYAPQPCSVCHEPAAVPPSASSASASASASASVSSCTVSALSDDVLVRIFRLLESPHTLVSCSLACRRWRHVLAQHRSSLWRVLYVTSAAWPAGPPQAYIRWCDDMVAGPHIHTLAYMHPWQHVACTTLLCLHAGHANHHRGEHVGEEDGNVDGAAVSDPCELGNEVLHPVRQSSAAAAAAMADSVMDLVTRCGRHALGSATFNLQPVMMTAHQHGLAAVDLRGLPLPRATWHGVIGCLSKHAPLLKVLHLDAVAVASGMLDQAQCIDGRAVDSTAAASQTVSVGSLDHVHTLGIHGPSDAPVFPVPLVAEEQALVLHVLRPNRNGSPHQHDNDDPDDNDTDDDDDGDGDGHDHCRVGVRALLLPRVTWTQSTRAVFMATHLRPWRDTLQELILPAFASNNGDPDPLPPTPLGMSRLRHLEVDVTGTEAFLTELEQILPHILAKCPPPHASAAAPGGGDVYTGKMRAAAPRVPLLGVGVHGARGGALWASLERILAPEHLVHLDLSDSGLRDLPEFNAPHLQTLRLARNELGTLPRSLLRLGEVEVLDLSENRLTSSPFAHVVAGMPALRVLVADENTLFTLHRPFASPHLHMLSLVGCRLTIIEPAVITSVPQLRYLRLAYNLLEDLPGEIGTLQDLRLLDIRCNPLGAWPVSIVTAWRAPHPEQCTALQTFLATRKVPEAMLLGSLLVDGAENKTRTVNTPTHPQQHQQQHDQDDQDDQPLHVDHSDVVWSCRSEEGASYAKLFAYPHLSASQRLKHMLWDVLVKREWRKAGKFARPVERGPHDYRAMMRPFREAQSIRAQPLAMHALLFPESGGRQSQRRARYSYWSPEPVQRISVANIVPHEMGSKQDHNSPHSRYAAVLFTTVKAGDKTREVLGWRLVLDTCTMRAVELEVLLTKTLVAIPRPKTY